MHTTDQQRSAQPAQRSLAPRRRWVPPQLSHETITDTHHLKNNVGLETGNSGHGPAS